MYPGNGFTIYIISSARHSQYLLTTRSEERGVLGVGSVPLETLPSCQENYYIVIA